MALAPRNSSVWQSGSPVQNGTLVVQPFADGLDKPMRLPNGVHAEVIGRAVPSLRKLWRPARVAPRSSLADGAGLLWNWSARPCLRGIERLRKGL